MHFTARSLREEDYGDDCWEASGSTKGNHCRECTAGCPQVDENESTGQLGKVLGRQAVLEVAMSVKKMADSDSTDEEAMENHKTSKQSNDLAGGNGEISILLCKRQKSEIELRWERSGNGLWRSKLLPRSCSLTRIR